MTSAFSFSKSRRLLNAADYRAVFDQVDWKVSNKEMLCLIKSNNSSHPRLGLVIAKKNVKHAVQRNRVKRIIRESFRLNQQQLPQVDIVFLARRGIDELTNAELHTELSKLWHRLNKKVLSSKSAVTPQNKA